MLEKQFFFFLLNTFLGHRWVQIQTNAFLLLLHWFSGATLALWKETFYMIVKYLWSFWVRIIILPFVVDDVWLIPLFSLSPQLDLRWYFICPRWRHCALFMFPLVPNAFIQLFIESFITHPTNVYLAPIILGPWDTKGKKKNLTWFLMCLKCSGWVRHIKTSTYTTW